MTIWESSMKKFTMTLTLILGFSLSTNVLANCESFGQTSSELFDQIDAGTLVQVSENFLTENAQFNDREKELVYKTVAKIEESDLSTVSSWDYIIENYEFPRSYNELHIVTFKNVKTNESYDYVWSYPGDNEYGVIFNSSGEIIAEVGDGDLYCL